MQLQLNFGGFYESEWDMILDDNLESDLDYLIENEGWSEYSTVCDLMDLIDWEESKKEMCRNIVQAFNNALLNEYNLNLDFIFKSLYSPKFYNFETDVIILEDVEDLEDITAKLYHVLVSNDLFENYKEMFNDAITIRDGYIPLYTADSMPLYQKTNMMLRILFDDSHDAIYDYVVGNGGYLIDK